MDWKKAIRERLAHLPNSIREATIQQVIADTEAGRAFGSQELQQQQAATARKELEEMEDAPERLRNLLEHW